MCNFRLANKYSKTVQTEVREYTIVVLPEPELGKLRKKVQDHGGQSNTCFRKVTQHVDQSTSGTNGLIYEINQQLNPFQIKCVARSQTNTLARGKISEFLNLGTV